MGRAPRTTVPGLVYHLLNRRVMRLPLFEKGRKRDITDWQHVAAPR